MGYQCGFAKHSIEKKFEKALLSIPNEKIREGIMHAVEQLALNPRPFRTKPFKQLKPPIPCYTLVARYRIRIGDYRVLYDIDDKNKIVWLIAIRKRSKRTYK